MPTLPTDTPELAAQRDQCSTELQAFIDRMVKDLGLPLPMVIDRLMISGAGLMTAAFGRKEAIRAALHLANQIDAGHLDMKPTIGGS